MAGYGYGYFQGGVPIGSNMNLFDELAPTNLSVNILTDTSIKINFTVNSLNAQGHKVERSTNGVDFTEIATLSYPTATYTDTSLADVTTYYYRVRAYSYTKYSTYSSIQSQFLNCIKLTCAAGLFDFSFDNSNGRLWIFPDGTTSTVQKPAKTLAAAGSVYLRSNSFAENYSLVDNTTDVRFTGSLADLQGKSTYLLSLNNCSNVTGSLADLQGRLTYLLDLANCANVTGSLADLQGKLTYFLRLNNCTNVTGVYTPAGSALPSLTFLDNTGISTADMDSTLINYANQAVAINKINGTFSALGKTRTAASDAAVATLVGKGWTVSGLTKI